LLSVDQQRTDETIRQDGGGGAATPRRLRTLIIGMGNPILSDDAIGIVLATGLKERLGDLPDVDVIEECCVGGLNLMDLMTGYDRLIAVDSIKTVDGVPGTWYAFDGTALRETMNLRNVHDANFATSLALGREMGTHLPADEECHIVAVEIAENMTFSEELTPDLQAALPALRVEIEAHVLAILARDG
jgi:hydrogenase maturation protease